MIKQLLAILFVAAVLIGTDALADIINWEHPREREDGTALPIQEISGYNIYNQQGTQINQALVTGTSYNINRIGTAQMIYVKTMDSDGRESQQSNSVIIPQLILTPPNPPVIYIGAGG